MPTPRAKSSPARKPAKQPGFSGELALIEHIRSRATLGSKSQALRLGIGDDCAILQPSPGEELVITTDLSLEGRHFRRDWHPAASVGHRTLARGLSDIAAMGARPLAAFLSLALPANLARERRWVTGFLDGLLALAAEHKVPLAGGDTSQSPGDFVLADIVLVGAAPTGRALRRSGARPGDVLYVTGALGGSATEFEALQSTPKKFAGATHRREHPHLFPEPRLSIGKAILRRNLATACIDTSDGLSTDLTHLCEASNVAAEIEISALPAHILTTALDDRAQITAVLHGGEDYELLFTARPETKVPASIDGVPIAAIGRILDRKKAPHRITIVAGDTRFELQPQGWQHLTP